MKRKGAALLLAAIVWMTLMPARLAMADTTEMFSVLTLNGQVIHLEKPILNVSGRSMLPMRSFFETLGADVAWDGPTQTAYASKGSHALIFTIGSRTLWADGKATTMDVPAQLIDGSTYVPVRVAAEGLGYTVDWSPTDGVSLRTNPDPMSAMLANHYDQAWHNQDRQHFGEVLAQLGQDRATAGSLLYAEWRALGEEMERLNKAALRGARGYTLYAPDQVVGLSVLWLGMQARTRLLEDLATNQAAKTLENYYPPYSFPIADSEEVATLDQPFGLTAEQADEQINALPMPDAVLYGQRIFLVPAKGKNASGYNWALQAPGHFGGKVIIFSGLSADLTRKVVAHELGHSLGKEIFTNEAYSLFDHSDNKTALADYGALYDRPITEYRQTSGYWGNDATENFAEDYAHLVTGRKKLADWPVLPDDKLRTFLDTHTQAIRLPTDILPVLRGLSLDLDGIEVPMLDMADSKTPDSEHLFVSRSGKVVVRAEGYLPGPRPMQVWADGRAFPFDANGVAIVTLPNPGKTYTLQFGFEPSKNSRWMIYGALPVLYSPY